MSPVPFAPGWQTAAPQNCRLSFPLDIFSSNPKPSYNPVTTPMFVYSTFSHVPRICVVCRVVSCVVCGPAIFEMPEFYKTVFKTFDCKCDLSSSNSDRSDETPSSLSTQVPQRHKGPAEEEEVCWSLAVHTLHDQGSKAVSYTHEENFNISTWASSISTYAIFQMFQISTYAIRLDNIFFQ